MRTFSHHNNNYDYSSIRSLVIADIPRDYNHTSTLQPSTSIIDILTF